MADITAHNRQKLPIDASHRALYGRAQRCETMTISTKQDIMTPTIDADLAEAAMAAKAWPFEEARKLIARIEKRGLARAAR